MDLLASEIRVLGCLIEKQRTTPDQYPLTLNALRLACNQSTNRDPVVEYDEPTIRDALHRLERRGFARFAGGAGSRAPKFRHLLAEALPMEEPEQAAMCVMMLRGPQTPGEIKQRGERLHPFSGIEEVDATLARLMDRGLVRRLERRRGQKEERFAQALGGQEDGAVSPGAASSPGSQAPAAGLGAAGGGSLAFAESASQGPRPGGPASAASQPPAEPASTPPVAEPASTPPHASASQLAALERLARRVAALEGEMRAIKAELGIDGGPAEQPSAAELPAGDGAEAGP